MDRIQLLKFLLVALAIPAQLLISTYWSKDYIQQNQEIQNLIQSLYDFKENYLKIEPWRKWYINLVLDKPKAFKGKIKQPNENNENHNDEIAVEVLVYRKDLKTFAESALTRSPRPSKVLYRTGQVVKHKKLNLYGVIIGWDEKLQASKDWLVKNYNQEELEIYREQPHYLVLVDKKYQEEFNHKSYIPQSEIQVVNSIKIMHNKLYSYFSNFDGKKYLKKKFLKTVYPHD